MYDIVVNKHAKLILLFHDMVAITCTGIISVYIYILVYVDVVSNIALISRKCLQLADAFKFTDFWGLVVRYMHIYVYLHTHTISTRVSHIILKNVSCQKIKNRNIL